MKKLVLENKDFVFNSSNGTLEVTNVAVQPYFNLMDLLLITNTSTNQIIYNFGCEGFGGTFNGNVLTFENTNLVVGMNESDVFQVILYDRGNTTEAAIQETSQHTREHLDALQNILEQQKLTNELLKLIAD